MLKSLIKLDRKYFLDVMIVLLCSSIFSLLFCYIIIFQFYSNGFSESELYMLLLIPLIIFSIIFPVVGVIIVKILGIRELPIEVPNKILWFIILLCFSLITVGSFDYLVYLINTKTFYNLGKAFDSFAGSENAEDSMAMYPFFVQGILQNSVGLLFGNIILTNFFKKNAYSHVQK